MTTLKCKATLRDEESDDVLFLVGNTYKVSERGMGKFGIRGEDDELYWFPMPIDEKEECITNQVFALLRQEVNHNE